MALLTTNQPNLPSFERIPTEREQRLKATLRTINVVSGLAGNELPIHPVMDAEGIKPDPGIYILQEAGEMLGAGARITDVNFVPEPELLSGVADSAHTVVAGSIVIDVRDQAVSSEIRTEVPVAVKCFAKRTFEDRFTRARREVEVMLDLRDQGRLTMEPVAIVVAPENGQTHSEVILVTRYDPGLLTLDNTAWGRGITPANVETATLAASALGSFNAEGKRRHDDAKIKNVAQKETGGVVGMIDYETSVPIDTSDPGQVSATAYTDFGLFISSLADKGFGTPLDNPDVREVVDGIAEAYLSKWGNSSSEVQTAAATGVLEALSSVEKTHRPSLWLS